MQTQSKTYRIMGHHVSFFASLFFGLFYFLVPAEHASSSAFPSNHLDLKQPITYEQMVDFLRNISTIDYITVTEEGQTVQGRTLFLVHAQRGNMEDPWRVFFFAQQHGDEPAGKDALLYLIRHLAEDPNELPGDVDLWIMPLVNPDGAAAGRRRNGNDADLNRDHLLLLQPETQVLHRLHRQLLPHLAVDCHEFGRDSRDYREKGWTEWPLIMMDTANHPLFDRRVYEAGLRWIDHMKPLMASAGHTYCRYIVGGAPPENEQRHSTLETDDARNGLGAYGGLSFIIESGIHHRAADPHADLKQRVDAYLTLFREFLHYRAYRTSDRKIIEDARQALLPAFLPVNSLWANTGPRLTDVPVIDTLSGKAVTVSTPNFMHDIIVKKSIPAPAGYIIEAEAASLFQPLLDRHGIIYQKLQKPQVYHAERCSLLRIEEDFDEVYSRYAGRQIVERKATHEHRFDTGAVFVSLEQPLPGRAAILLEPAMLYGLYQYPEFQVLIGDDGHLPVWRVIYEEQ